MDTKLEKISFEAFVEDITIRVLKNLSEGVVRRKLELDTKFNEGGNTVLYFAAANGSVEVVKELLTVVHGDLCLVQDESGLDPIHHVAQKGKHKVLMETILHLAVRSNCLEVLKFTIERRAIDAKFISAKNVRRNNILHLAVARKQLQTVKFLVNQKGIDEHAVNKKSLTPPDLIKESPLQTGDDKIRAVLLELNGTTTLSYPTISLAQEKITFAAHETDSKAEKTHAPFEHHSTLQYLLFHNEFKAAPFMSSTIPFVAGKYDSDINLLANVILIATATYLNIISIPLFCSVPFEKSRMIFALITGLGSIIIFIFRGIRIKFAPAKIIALSMLFGTLIAMLQILPEHDRATLTVFITANFQLALCVQQLKKIEKTDGQANLFRTNTRELQIARTAKFLTLAFISFAVASYYCFMVYETTLSFAKAMPQNTAERGV